MYVPGVSGSKHTPRDHGFLDGLPAWQLMGFRSYVDIPQLERFLARNALGTDVEAFTTRPSLASARELITRLSALELMDFRNYMYTPSFVEANAAQFLHLDWIDVSALKKHSDDLFPQESDISVAAQPVNIQNTATTSQYIPVRTLATHPQNLPAAGTVLAELAQPVITEYDSVPPEPELDFRSMTDSQLADYLASFIFDTPSGAESGPDYVAPCNFNTFQPFDPVPAFNPLMPATPPPDHSSQTFPFTFMEPSPTPVPHFSSEFSLPLSHADDVQWPMLPPIRPRSPSGTDSADEIPAESATTSNITKNGRRRQEVDPANILRSVRSRNPSRRKRCSEEEPEPAKKRDKTSKDSG
ncbi:hypothetical protein B0H13DRAFT_1907618 [Mycena leptocephala]|nr:hypothetical protein B0H13DRAFT_1907618 [Mycena leptocephala]